MRTTFRGLGGVVHRLTDLPVKKPGMRWSHLQKAIVLGALRAGALTEDDAGERYDLPPDELREWATAYDARGLDGLKVTKRARNGADLHSGRSAAAGPISGKGLGT